MTCPWDLSDIIQGFREIQGMLGKCEDHGMPEPCTTCKVIAEEYQKAMRDWKSMGD